jgi:SusD/RagB-like outer membrane lipoprotein
MPVVAAVAVVFSGCSLEVLNPGAIQDADLNTAELMPTLVAGVSAEYNQIGDGYAFDGGRLTDELAGTGSYTSTQEYRQGIFDWLRSEGLWSNTHEAAWSADQAWVRMGEVLGDAVNTDSNAARLWAIRGFSRVRLGENFCQVVFDVQDWEERTAAFTRAITDFNMAVTIGNASGGNGAQWATAAYAGIAQAQLGLASYGSVSWADVETAATTAMNQGADVDWFDQAIYHAQANTNQVWNESWGRGEVGVYRTMAQAMADNGDPRTPYTRCGEWNNPTDAYPAIITGGVTSTGNCTGQGSGAQQGADGEHAHYRQDKYTERGTDINRASGLEMLLIRAEARMMQGDFQGFIDDINDVRDEYGLANLATPTQVGTLTFAQDADWTAKLASTDAMEILDRERYATLWVEGRRLYDLDRWDHPFLNGGWIVGSAALPRRVSCMPIAKTECQLNPELFDDANGVCSG